MAAAFTEVAWRQLFVAPEILPFQMRSKLFIKALEAFRHSLFTFCCIALLEVKSGYQSQLHYWSAIWQLEC